MLVQNRAKSWAGWSFPGGHVEPGESFAASAKREVLEETGLTVDNLRCCGVIHWENSRTKDRYIVFLYKTESFRGELKQNCAEGQHFWVTLEELKNHPSTNDTPKYLPVFLQEEIGEAYGLWNEDSPWELKYY